MLFGAEQAEGHALAHTIYVWPSRELMARSWHWPEPWHDAFEQAASQIAGMVASYVLGGLPVSRQPITIELPAGCVSFSVKCLATSIYIAVSEFQGPLPPEPDPGPDGGSRRQPSAADGLILGLRGSGKCFTVVTFYGPLRPIPVGRITMQPQASTITLRVSGGSETAISNGRCESRSLRSDLASVLKPGATNNCLIYFEEGRPAVRACQCSGAGHLRLC